jgi:SAM-dependent methyltransferase
VARDPETDTRDREYTERLIRLQRAPWKRWLDVQAPYRWNLRRLSPGFTLEVGCGIGRNLEHLRGQGVGLDHNPYSVAAARQAGLRAYTPDEFRGSDWDKPAAFDSLLLSHVAEHMRVEEATQLLATYLPYLRSRGRVVVITPQERGFESDSTHVTFMGFEELASIVSALRLEMEAQYSFPFPRIAGRVFKYNEFVMICRNP